MDDTSIGQDRDFVEFIVKQIVEQPEDIEIHREIDAQGVLITLKVAQDDMGKIVGKNGQTAKALRALLRIIGAKNNLKINLQILEPAKR